MVNPLIAILIASIILILLGLFFWPKSGFVAKWIRGRLNTKRVLLEDALKHLFDCEYKKKWRLSLDIFNRNKPSYKNKRNNSKNKMFTLNHKMIGRGRP